MRILLLPAFQEFCRRSQMGQRRLAEWCGQLCGHRVEAAVEDGQGNAIAIDQRLIAGCQPMDAQQVAGVVAAKTGQRRHRRIFAR